jgi:hypothetical protein
MAKFFTEEEWAEKNKMYYSPNVQLLESLQEKPVEVKVDLKKEKKKAANQKYRAQLKNNREEFISVEKLVQAAISAGVPRLEIAIVCNLSRNQVNRAVRRIKLKTQIDI